MQDKQAAEEERRVTFTVRIPAALKWHLQVRAASTDQTIQALVEQALTQFLGAPS